MSSVLGLRGMRHYYLGVVIGGMIVVAPIEHLLENSYK